MTSRALLLCLCLLPLLGDRMLTPAADPIIDKDAPAPTKTEADSTKPAPSSVTAKALPDVSPDVAYQAIAEAKERAILTALNQTTSLEFFEVPLRDILRYLPEKLHVPIVIDPKIERDPFDSVVTIRVKDISGRAALNLLLGPREMGWVIADEVLWITSVEKAGQVLRTKVYDVADLVLGADGDTEPDFDSLIELITSTIRPPSWDTVGGPGSIKGFSAGDKCTIVISQTLGVEEEVSALLAALRAVPQPARPRAATPRTSSSGKAKGGMPDAPPVTAELSAAARGNNQFACDLYAKLLKAAPLERNLVYSPLSMTMALGMAYAGARGETADEMARAMRFGLPAELLHPTLGVLQNSLATRDPKGAQMVVANRLWCEKDHLFLDPFLEITRTHYGAEMGAIDFRAPEAARKEINDWVASQTNKKIEQILPPGSLDTKSNPRLVLVNAVYFNGKWVTPFMKEATKPAKFFSLGSGAPHQEVTVPLMVQLETLRYASADRVQIVELPYGGTNLAMTIILPDKEPAAFAALQAQLTAEKIDFWLALLKPRLVYLSLPAFEMTCDVPLTEMLQALGMKRAFDATGKSVDFSGIDGQIGKDRLFLKDVFHQAYIDVNERGTEAAAATAGGFGGGGAMARTQPVTFRADHPFVFLIRDTHTGCIVFMGQFVRPDSSPLLPPQMLEK